MIIPDLPIADYRPQILESVDWNQVTIIVAETGAGKSTQVPQYLAEHGYEKVVVTQPRILAARNLSMRVREEWGWRHAEGAVDFVAYRTAHERDDTDFTTILYCTDGLQLVREVTGAGIGRRQVLVLDEIHEWNQNMEVLVAWAKKRCLENPEFKVVVMSATIDADSLARYFGARAPIVVPGRSHPIAKRQGRDLVDELFIQIETPGRNVLVFLPGKSEIESVASRVSWEAGRRNIPVIPLHSQIEAADQQLAFESYPNGKIILATNIAQTSITIDDIDMVIDSGLERRSEIENGVEGLAIGQTSRADCLQRAGRAGRTKSGDYVLASLDRMPCDPIEKRDPYAVPEILRTHLDRLALRLASAGIDIEELEFFHAPSSDAIVDAKRTLRNLGAMTAEGAVTEVGARMERFPVESRYARMLVESEQFSDSVRLKLAAIIAIQEVGGTVKGGTRYLGWRQFTRQTRSDLLAQYDVYIALPKVFPEEYEDLGIIAKNEEKAGETFSRLARDLGFASLELSPIDSTEEEALMRCIVAGQIDQVWIIGVDGTASHVSGGIRRELSGGTVVARSGLVTGTPFNLEVPTAKGLETLYLLQDLTAADPRWLETAAPGKFKAQPGKPYFDGARGGLAQRWTLEHKGKVIKGASTPITEKTPQNKALFMDLGGTWLHARLEEDRIRLQKERGAKIPAVPLHQLRKRMRDVVGDEISFEALDAQRKAAAFALTSMRTFMDESELARLGNRRKSQRIQRKRGRH